MERISCDILSTTDHPQKRHPRGLASGASAAHRRFVRALLRVQAAPDQWLWQAWNDFLPFGSLADFLRRGTQITPISIQTILAILEYNLHPVAVGGEYLKQFQC
jgi:hypothetical protein